MRPLHISLFLLVLVLQYPLWFGSASVASVWRLDSQIAAQKEHNAHLLERNQALHADVLNLKSGIDAIEERARLELGMIRSGETFYQIVKPANR